MFLAAQWYNRQDRAGAVYIGSWSFHWGIRGPIFYENGRVVTKREQPRRAFVVYRGWQKPLELLVWRHRGYCEHGFRKSAEWHRCDYVTAENPDGRPSDDELRPEDA